MERDFKSNTNSTYSCKDDVVFCPKYRRKVLTPPIDTRLKEIIAGVAEETRPTVMEMAILPDHVPLLCEVDAQYGIATFVRLLTGRSARLLRQEFPTLPSRLPTLWTHSVFCSTVGSAPLSVIKQSIANQKNH